MADPVANGNGTNGNGNGSIPKWAESAPMVVQIAMYIERNYGKFGLAVLIFVGIGYKFGPWVSDHIIDPTIRTYNESIEKTSEANIINAQTNKQNAETQKATADAIAQIRILDQTKLDRLDDIGAHLKASGEEMRKVVGKLQEFEESQDKSLKTIAEKVKAGGG
jgi:hypothetical protein